MVSESVFEAVRRGYSNLDNATPETIVDYFSTIDSRELTGHINNIKGIVFEEHVVDALNEKGIHAIMFEQVNHPITDIAVIEDGDVITEFQLKATDSVAYISNTLEENPDVPIIVTSEVAQNFDDCNMVIDSGINNADLTDAVTETLYGSDTVSELVSDSTEENLAELVTDTALPIPISPIGIGISIIGAFFGMFF
ncbi:MAG: hypothetical protein Q4E81_08975 [Succinatimonas sp.]|nr:hypothetical protein [Succinatimonas sp.]